jgi:hypothetical protein
MHISAKLWNGVWAALIALPFSICIHTDALPHPQGRLGSLPRVTLWAWERREDLHALDSHRFAVAYLDRTITIGLTAQSQPRRSLLVIPSKVTRIPVVRIEAASTAVLNDETRKEIVEAILPSASQPGIAALQIDFDATRSQRWFYRDLLFDLRRRMPPALPLSITALASWCSHDDWIQNLPIDEAVPMMFRMEPDRRRASPDIDDFQIRESLCRSSVGISTTEAWPSDLDGKRVYIFADNGWRADPPSDVERRLR